MSLLDDLKKYVKEEDEIAQPGAGIDIRFNNLDSVTQKKIMEAVMEDLNVDADDEFANKKILDGFAKVPLITLTGKDITNKISFEV